MIDDYENPIDYIKRIFCILNSSILLTKLPYDKLFKYK